MEKILGSQDASEWLEESRTEEGDRDEDNILAQDSPGLSSIVASRDQRQPEHAYGTARSHGPSGWEQ